MSELKKIYTPIFESLVNNLKQRKKDNIFVLSGLSPYVDLDKYSEYIVDKATFDKEGNDLLFSKSWFIEVFGILNGSKDFHILSHQQYAYLIEYISPDFFKDKTILIYDNLRSLYPIDAREYVESTNENGLEERSEMMPVYQAEQFRVGENCFYSLKKFDNITKSIPFFSEQKQLSQDSSTYSTNFVDIVSNPYAIDFFLNQCIKSGNFTKRMVIKTYNKYTLGTTIQSELELLNCLLSHFNGGIYIQKEDSVKADYTPSEDATSLLKKYWGNEANFRTINVYENPDFGNSTIPISQGLIVDTIVNEYNNGRNGITPRDVFITAPTGAGKSLIFQLPAFYAAEKGDITIVVSPLKALMTDQVNNLHKERNYTRVEFINSDLNIIDRDRIITLCKNGEIDILYLSPELLLSYDIRYFIGERQLGLLIIDEAHLITTWGRDFRVDYWFLGNHINKIRKYSSYLFPMVALTATAVYGGTNDMVFDSISSLNMNNPHKFIGEVRRSDIEFVIDTHDNYTEGSYDMNKENETVEFIKGVHELGLKTIVYAPYTRHIERLRNNTSAINPQMAVSFHGSMNQDEQQYAYRSFRNNDCKVMICTKAFGMGIDIPDIQVVYHHAPSGLLPDYIQEIGRAARKKDILGFAALTFSPADLRYSKQLFGMSSLKTYQLREVLRKIYRYFTINGNKRNMLMSANDFAYIFDSNDEVDQKVSTALMMIEKDYLIKYRFNVLIARPKKLFTKVYARISTVSLQRLSERYSDCFTKIYAFRNDTWHFIELNLDKIWARHFVEKSFPQIKNEFYKRQFLKEDGIELIPLIKVTHSLDKSITEVQQTLTHIFLGLKSAFAELRRQGAFFTEKELVNVASNHISGKYNIEKVVSFIVSTFAGRQIQQGTLEGDAFLQRRRQGAYDLYRVFNTNYEAKFSQLLRLFSSLFDKDVDSVSRFVTIGEVAVKNHIRLGSLIEILNIGSFETQGGDDPKLFIRINDPRKIKKDSEDKNYKNFILESVKNRHKSSCSLFEHFFTNYMSNETRWDLIEDFFLGASNDDLFVKYPGSTKNHINIIDYIKKNIKYHNEAVKLDTSYEPVHAFTPVKGTMYFADSLLTIGQRTLKIKQWLMDDPVLLHRTIVEYDLKIEKEYYKVLMSKIQNNYFDYYRDFMQLKLYIEFPKYSSKVQAIVPFKDDPVAFYKWWRKNPNKVALRTEDLIDLFVRVNQVNPKALLKVHLKMIEK